MTLRLVGLMSAVLLLSLAAFGLLMSHHQDRVMTEVARTVSEAGRATLRTFELHGESFGVDGPAEAVGDVMVWHAAPGATVLPEGGAGAGHVRRMVIARVDEEGGVRRREVEERVSTREVATIDRDGFDAARPGDDPGPAAPPLEGPPGARADSERMAARFFIDVEEIHAEPDPAHGVVLKFPRLHPAPGDARSHTRIEVAASGAGSAHDVVVTTRDEIQLPIPGDYAQLFARLRGRSLFLFLGVLLVGVTLSAAVASRFTRPIRKLDAGIRRLSAGDLDVRVDAGGKDEIGRLSRAFNEMAGRLRANRDRSRELARREKLSALGRLAAGVAHDVRNPLHSIGLSLQHLRETARPETAERAAEFDGTLDVIRGEIRRLDQLVGNFLRFAKSERRERERVCLSELIRETARLVLKEAERRGIELVLDLDEATPPVLADGESLRSSLLNLVLNSFEAMPDGGRLTLRLGADGAEACVEVGDTGEGIPAEQQEHVFDFAFTTKDSGNGLGLAMVHHCVVEEHGGRVSLESRAGEGTRVRLSLPLHGGVAA